MKTMLALCGLAALAACSPSESKDDPLPDPQLGSCNLYLPPGVQTITYTLYGAGGQSDYRLARRPNGYLGREAIRMPEAGEAAAGRRRRLQFDGVGFAR